jgi:hypothetical protein
MRSVATVLAWRAIRLQVQSRAALQKRGEKFAALSRDAATLKNENLRLKGTFEANLKLKIKNAKLRT